MDYEEINRTLKTSSGDFMKYLTFIVGGQVFGISTSDVIEIVQLQPATGVSELPPFVKGIINLRGREVKLIDVNLRFGYQENEYTERTCVVIADINGTQVGLIVDEVTDVLVMDDTVISPPVSFSGDASSGYVTGICKMDGHMVLLLNCSSLLFGTDYFAV